MHLKFSLIRRVAMLICVCILASLCFFELWYALESHNVDGEIVAIKETTFFQTNPRSTGSSFRMRSQIVYEFAENGVRHSGAVSLPGNAYAVGQKINIQVLDASENRFRVRYPGLVNPAQQVIGLATLIVIAISYSMRSSANGRT
jgi:hypothetical protein